jgi:hypothetical protein
MKVRGSLRVRNRQVSLSMGGASASCMTGTCNHEAQDEVSFTKSLVVDSPRDNVKDILEDIVTNHSTHGVPLRSLESDGAFSSDSGSHQSVLSTISPTKDRAPSPTR